VNAEQCPACGKDVRTVEKERKHRPFCSERCQLLDLGDWLDERYRIPGDPSDAGI